MDKPPFEKGIESKGPSARKPGRFTYTSQKEKIRHFAFGFAGWFAVNGLLWWLLSNLDLYNNFDLVLQVGFLIIFANVAFLIWMGFKARWIALGLLSAFALNFATTLFIGLGVRSVCFILLNTAF